MTEIVSRAVDKIAEEISVQGEQNLPTSLKDKYSQVIVKEAPLGKVIIKGVLKADNSHTELIGEDDYLAAYGHLPMKELVGDLSPDYWLAENRIPYLQQRKMPVSVLTGIAPLTGIPKNLRAKFSSVQVFETPDGKEKVMGRPKDGGDSILLNDDEISQIYQTPEDNRVLQSRMAALESELDQQQRSYQAREAELQAFIKEQKRQLQSMHGNLTRAVERERALQEALRLQDGNPSKSRPNDESWGARLSRRWESTTGIVGWYLSGRPYARLLEYVDDRQNRRVVVKPGDLPGGVDEDRKVYKERERGIGAAVIAVGSLAAAAGVGYLISRYTGDHNHVVNHYVQSSGADHSHTIVLGSGNGGYRHAEAIVPSDIHPQRVEGHTILVDNHNNTIVGPQDMPRGIEKENGVLSQGAVAKLRKLGHIVRHHIINDGGRAKFYESIVT